MKKYTKEQILIAAEIGEVSMIDARHIVSLLDEAVILERERIVMNVNEYGKWDLHFIKQCDILFVYVERTNTSCIGLCCEAGFAKGLGKTVITILEPNHETIKDAYLSFITQVSDIVFEDLESGINYLKSFAI